MKTEIQRYLVENQGFCRVVLERAFGEADQICQDLGIDRITLLVTKKEFFATSECAKYLGVGIADELRKFGTARWKDYVCTLESVKTLIPNEPYGLVFAVHFNGALDLLDSIVSAEAILFLPLSEMEGKEWSATWGPTILGPDTWRVPLAQLSPELDKVMKQIGIAVGRSARLLNKSDKHLVEAHLQQLGPQSLSTNPEVVRQSAIRNGWDCQAARDLAELYKKVIT